MIDAPLQDGHGFTESCQNAGGGRPSGVAAAALGNAGHDMAAVALDLPEERIAKRKKTSEVVTAMLMTSKTIMIHVSTAPLSANERSSTT